MIWLVRVLITLGFLGMMLEATWAGAQLLNSPSDLLVLGGVVVTIVSWWITVVVLWFIWRDACLSLSDWFKR